MVGAPTPALISSAGLVGDHRIHCHVIRIDRNPLVDLEGKSDRQLVGGRGAPGKESIVEAAAATQAMIVAGEGETRNEDKVGRERNFEIGLLPQGRWNNVSLFAFCDGGSFERRDLGFGSQ